MTTATRRLSAPSRLLVTIVLTLASIAAGILLDAAPAEAWYTANKSRRPGAVVISPPQAIDSYDGWVMYLNWRTQRGPLVYRSPKTRGPQDVMGVYTVQEWGSQTGWTNVTSQVTGLHRIPAGRRAVRLPALDRAPTTQRGYFRVRFAFAWVNARTSAPLGARVVLPNLASDHRCITNRRPCQTGPGWIRTGKLYTHSGGW